MRLAVTHETTYDYASPVSLAHHVAHLQPLEDEQQRLQAFELAIEPPPGHQRSSVDAMGNTQQHFSVLQPHRRLSVRSQCDVVLEPRFAGLEPSGSPAWNELADALRYAARAPFQPAVEYTLPSPYVPRLPALRAYARPSFATGRPVAAAAIELMQRLHDDFRYDSQSTQVDTPLAEAFAQRRGVCQDFAHLLAGSLRMMGLPARYVSGYLLTSAPEDGQALLGADASHAWVQVWCPGTPGVPETGPGAGWLDLDPTNRLVPGAGHVRLALGRDYGDVAPLRGVIRGGGGHVLTVAVSTRVLDPAPEGAGDRARRLLGQGQEESTPP